MRWLERYITEGSPRLQHSRRIGASLAKREPTDRDGQTASRQRIEDD